MRVMSEPQLGRTLIQQGLESSELIMCTRDHKPTAVLVPYEIWFQVQHFISRVIEG
jgi:hypothetical protein